MYIAAFLLFFYLVMATIQHTAEEPITLFSWNSAVITICVFASLVCFTFYARFQKSQATLREKEIEHKTLLYYMDECEHQQTAMRKFKHDYQNILISMDSFLEEDDLPGLKQYYTTKIKAASDVITKSDFALEALSKIKVRELKGVLTAKLTMAQNLGIDTIFEADEEIDHISMNSVTLVRMLGIILDNAIEALDALGKGQLRAACLKTGGGVMFIVQNDCSSDMPKLHRLQQAGFSTKGEGRGLGLNNLWELAGTCPNVTLQTNISDGKFIQRLMIGDL